MEMTKENAPKLRFPGFIEDWEQRKLPEFVEFYSGLTYTPEDVRESGTLVLRSSNVKNGEIVDADNVYVDPARATSQNVQDGDIIVVVRNGSRALIGKHAAIKGNMPNTVIGAFMTGIRSEHSSFVNALLDTPQFIKEIEKNLGATINQITGYMFSEMKFYVPSFDEQEHIGAFFESLDNLITLHQHKLEQIKEYKKGMLQKMFPKQGETVPEIRFLGFTEDWEQRKLMEILEERHTISTYSEEYPRLSFTIEEGIISPEDRKTNKRDFLIKDEENKKYLITELDDIIYNPANVVYGAIHRNTYGKGCVSPIYKIFKTSENPAFMGYVVRNERFIQELSQLTEGTVTKLKTLKSNAFLEKEVKIPVSLDEQKLIGEFFTNMDTAITLHQHKLDQMKEYKKGLLQQMFV